MLDLYFPEPLTAEQSEQLFEEFINYAQRYEHDFSPEFDTKVTVYVGDNDDAMKIVDKLVSLNYTFGHCLFNAEPLFRDEFVEIDPDLVLFGSRAVVETGQKQESEENEPVDVPSPPSASVSQIFEQKPMRIRAGEEEQTNDEESVERHHSPPPVLPQLQLQLQQQQYVTSVQWEDLQKSQNLMRTMLTELTRKLDTAQSAPSTPTAPAAASTSQLAKTVPRSMEFRAKNELITNGIQCKKCQDTIRGEENIGKLIEKVREHVMGHFNSECPHLKRFECGICKPAFRSNFVEEFESHLKKHGGSMGDTRKKLTRILLTETHLEMICRLSNKSFPEVFEKKAPELRATHVVHPPAKAKSLVFPPLDHNFCLKYNVPTAHRGRASLPVKLISLN